MLTTLGGACLGAADKHAHTLAGASAALNSDRPFYGTTFGISGVADLYLIDYAAIFVLRDWKIRRFSGKSGQELTKMG